MNFLYFLRRLWDYIPILWADRDWDYMYMLALLEKKLQRMQVALGKGPAADAEQVAAEIGRALRILEKLQNKGPEGYYQKLEKYIELRYGAITDIVPGRNGIEFIHTKTLTAVEKKEYTRLILELHRLQMQEYQRDWDKLWRILSKCSQKWWS